ncbi:hypothetical protein BGX23_011836 [Mortierella sp. AD031]|nr:hypothetical protein BGX23_011836 [Mortierella sp. AD031]
METKDILQEAREAHQKVYEASGVSVSYDELGKAVAMKVIIPYLNSDGYNSDDDDQSELVESAADEVDEVFSSHGGRNKNTVTKSAVETAKKLSEILSPVYSGGAGTTEFLASSQDEDPKMACYSREN